MTDMESPRRTNGEGSGVNLAGDVQSNNSAAAATPAAKATEAIYTLATDAQGRSCHLEALFFCIDEIVDDMFPEGDSHRRRRLNQLASLAQLGSAEVGRLQAMLEEIEVESHRITREGR